MTWLAPHWLWLLAAVPCAAALVLHAHARRRRAAERFVGAAVGPRLLPPLERRRAFARAALLAAGVALASLASAGPSWGTREEVIYTRGVDVVIALDVSRSMLSENETLTPLARAKASLERLVRESPGDRLGLVLFAGGAAQSCVLTSDAGFFLDALRSAEPSDAGRGGTRIGTALFAAHRVLEPRWFARHRKLFELVSDSALIRANRESLCKLLGVPESADLEVELERLFDPRWLEQHESELTAVFGESWSASDLDDEAELRFEATGDAALDPRRGGKIVVLITDGIDQDSMPKLAARLLARRGVRLVTVGVGDEGRGERPLVLGGQPQRSRDGQPILLEFDSALLRELASLANGFYVGTADLLRLAERYRAEFPELEETRGRRMTLRRGIERYPYFLAPALLCLALYFATPAVRRRPNGAGARASAAVAAILVVAPALLVSCGGDETSRRAGEALAALASGEAKRAEDLLRALQEERPEDPRLAYDRALALQALGDASGADREYKKARTGSRALAARAAFNQGTLALAALRAQLRRDGEERAAEALPAAERRAFEDGIARAQVAFEEARRLDPDLTEASRAERDLVRWRHALRDAWRRADVAARVKELEQAEGAAIAEKLERWQREILEQGLLDPLGSALREHEMIDALDLLAERIGADEALAVPQRDALQARARALGEPLRVAADALEQLELEAALDSGRRVAEELASIWTAWAPLDAVLKRLVADGRVLTAPREEGAARPPAGALAERTRTWVERESTAAQPLFGKATTAWIREALPRAEEALSEAETSTTAEPLASARERFEDASMALELEALELLPLIERLAREQEALPAQIEQEAPRAFAVQERLERSLETAREKLDSSFAAKEGATPEEIEAQGRVRDALRGEIDAAGEAMRAALAAREDPAAARTQARTAAAHLRETWGRLAEFEALLRHGLEIAREAIASVAGAHAEEAGSDALGTIARLRARLPLEIERMQRAAEVPVAGSSEDPDEAAEIAGILREADPKLGKARDAALRGLEASRRGDGEEATKAWEEALAGLQEILAALEEARKTLFERLEIALVRERLARAATCDALESAEEQPRQTVQEQQRTNHAELATEIERLRRALQRELARRERAAQEPPPEGAARPPEPDDAEELRTEVEAAIAALDLVRTTIAEDDLEVALRAIAEAYAALRLPWTRLASFEQLVRGAIEEERAVIERTRSNPASPRAKRFARDLQGETRGQLDPILRKAPAAPPTPQAPPVPPNASQGSAPPPDPGEVARRNVPLAREAMLSAEGAVETEEPSSALPFEEEALRLLEEILQSQDERQPPQSSPQDQPADEQPPEQPSSPSQARPENAPLSREEIERLLRLAHERKPKSEPAAQRQRTPVEEDH